MAGVDIRTIAELAGHKTLTMAMRYSHLYAAYLKSAITKLDSGVRDGDGAAA